MKRIVFFLMCLVGLAGRAQTDAYGRYIAQYKDMAIEQMRRHGIPASITLAQGLLESGAGQSYLARVANNHFGIKTAGVWTGPYVVKDDDARAEHFRKYGSPRESYEDHSRFLLRPRYAALFKLSSTDYRGWAHGLKAAGYATNPQYAEKLIEIIERYHLAQYDAPVLTAEPPAVLEATSAGLQVFRCNGRAYVVARAGDTFRSLARQTGVSARKLRRYNDVGKTYQLQAGEPVYLQRKASRAAKAFKGQYHEVKAGESMHSIAQHYGVRLKSLYRKNQLPPGSGVSVGDRLRVY